MDSDKATFEQIRDGLDKVLEAMDGFHSAGKMAKVLLKEAVLLSLGVLVGVWLEMDPERALWVAFVPVLFARLALTLLVVFAVGYMREPLVGLRDDLRRIGGEL